ncbi:MAG: hypothetical protein GKR89_32685 [Candidatus Latescibacteria bacterium]|nr:hypothetical protein [Candidatus Latescibacterota bacterium]
MRDIWGQIQQWHGRRPFALARVVRTWGSSPRQVGAAMIVDGEMAVAGSVSGGCIEGAVVEEALQVLGGGAPRQAEYGVEDETAWAVGLSCGGELTVRVEAMPGEGELWAALAEAVEDGEPVVWLSRLEGDGHLLVYTDGRTVGEWGDDVDEAVAIALDAYASRQSQVVELAGGETFAHVLASPDQAVIIGAGHIAVPLVGYLRALDFATVVIDPRKVFARPARFAEPPHQLFDQWPQKVLEGWNLGEDCYGILLTHDPKIDDEALHIFLRSPMVYIGALGSRKTHAKRCQRLQEAGFSAEDIQRVKGPVGLAIGAQSPAEIALSIAAEMVAARRGDREWVR